MSGKEARSKILPTVLIMGQFWPIQKIAPKFSLMPLWSQHLHILFVCDAFCSLYISTPEAKHKSCLILEIFHCGARPENLKLDFFVILIICREVGFLIQHLWCYFIQQFLLGNNDSIVQSFCCNKLHHPNYNQCCCFHHHTMSLQPILDVHMGIGLNFLLLKIAGPLLQR